MPGIVAEELFPVNQQSQFSERDCPLVTFGLFAYNQELFIRDAVAGALAQTYSPLEIILSDDCSTDSTFDLIQCLAEEYRGPHTVKVVRNKRNLGVCEHVNKLVDSSDGDLIVVAAGDDISLPERVAELVRVWRETGASAVYSNAELIDEVGKEVGEWKISDRPVKKTVRIRQPSDVDVPRFYGAGAAYDRRLFTVFGPLPTDIRNEDYNLAWRAVLMDGIAYSTKKLLRYRKHEGNLSYWSKISRAGSVRERVGYRMRMIENEMMNLQHIIGYAGMRFGADSSVVAAIKRISMKLESRKCRPYGYELWCLWKDFLAQFGFARWLVNTLRVNGKWRFLKSD